MIRNRVFADNCEICNAELERPSERFRKICDKCTDSAWSKLCRTLENEINELEAEVSKLQTDATKANHQLRVTEFKLSRAAHLYAQAMERIDELNEEIKQLKSKAK